MNNEHIDRLIIKHIEGICSESEQIEVLNWIEADPRNRAHYMKIRKLCDIAIWQEKPKQISKKKIKPFSLPFLQRAVSFAAGIAAMLLLYIGLNTYNAHTDNTQTCTITVPEGHRAHLTLADSTKIWLNAGTTLTYPAVFNKKTREVTIDGEAHFDVEHNSNWPFIVHTPTTYDVQVLGTEFNICSYKTGQIFEVSLISGSVNIFSNTSEESVILSPNEACVLRNGQLVKAAIDIDHTMWKDGLIAFSNESLRDAFNKLELYYGVKINVLDESLYAYCYTAKFRHRDGIEHIMNILCSLNAGVVYSYDYDSNTITVTHQN